MTNYSRHHSAEPTFDNLLFASWKFFLFGTIFFLATGGLMFAAGVPAAGWYWLGVWAGAVLLTLGNLRAYLKLWPLLDQILDWDRVRRLLDERNGAGRPDA